MGVTVYSTFMGWCDCLEHFYGWVWVGVTGCGWVGKMAKPKKNIDFHSFIIWISEKSLLNILF